MKYCNIGGQAILEGVMMKGPDSYAIAVRKPDNEIQVEKHKYKSYGEVHKLNNIPLVRGIVNFIESLYIGLKTLMDSAQYFEDEDDPKKTEAEKKKDKEEMDKLKEKSSEKGYLILTLVFSLVFAIGLFVLLPTLLSTILYKFTDNNFIVNFAEGILRLIIFLVYVYVITVNKDIKRTYMYHGAEHKTINCMESGKDLTVENVRAASRFHKRCGTSFVFLVMLISILLFMVINTDILWLRLLYRVVLIPIVGGITYEIIRYAGRHENAFANILSKPGLWLQRLTTREPDDDMIEVAVKSVEAVIDWREYVKCVNNNSFEK